MDLYVALDNLLESCALALEVEFVANDGMIAYVGAEPGFHFVSELISAEM